MNVENARHAFITGGASGIGLAIAEALAARGVRVTIADVNREALDAVLAANAGTMRGTCLDVRDRAGWATAKAEAEAAFGPVDILINNAGIASIGFEIADMDPEAFDRVVAVDLTGVFNGVSAFAADMRARRQGHIVNTASPRPCARNWRRMMSAFRCCAPDRSRPGLLKTARSSAAR
jgi:NAD(P)-dependent dehydrogenase (short-subunit alcohol dehydrogenase family)